MGILMMISYRHCRRRGGSEEWESGGAMRVMEYHFYMYGVRCKQLIAHFFRLSNMITTTSAAI
jgi:hypothetical protein